MRVRPDHCVGDGVLPTLPTPGTFIPIEDHHLLKEDFEEFEMGEYVGYEVDDDDSGMPVVIYAVILERIDEEEFFHVRRGSESDDHAACTHRRFTQQYSISVGDDRQPTLAFSTDLYKFHRVDGLVSSRGGSASDPSGRRGSLGPPKSPRPNYRESFYRSSVFEPDEVKAWEQRGPAPSAAAGSDIFARSGTTEDGDPARRRSAAAEPRSSEFGDDVSAEHGLDEEDFEAAARHRLHTIASDDAEFETAAEDDTEFDVGQHANGFIDQEPDDGRGFADQLPAEEEEITVEQVKRCNMV